MNEALKHNRIGFVIATVWEWLFGEIRHAALLVMRVEYIPKVEFYSSALLMILGVWLIIFTRMPLVGGVSEVLLAALPSWWWGAMLFIFGRYGIHAMLSPDEDKRAWSVSLMLGCWIFLTVGSLMVDPLAIQTALLLAITARVSYLFWQYLQLRKVC